ncbi:hypothetical protein GIB67_011532 [Kingdonia uniflora]|uniref:S-acyltransferase n=1 Tax=Kingdonia uniflora TaxID=39325 RepID=A0A7J7NLS1_9MAGN|nr:hypothetical protein GIB67_011532 [Kingdonia uniflora]
MASTSQSQEANTKISETKHTISFPNPADIESMVEVDDDNRSLPLHNSNTDTRAVPHEVDVVNGDEDEKYVAFAQECPIRTKNCIWEQCPLIGGDSDTIRTYHFWPGKNVFFFRGRLVCGPDPRGFLLMMTSIVLSSWIFYVYIGEDSKHSTFIVSISTILAIIVLGNLIMVSVTDPGIIPRNCHLSRNEVVTNDGVKSKLMRVNGVEVKSKFCGVCKIFRPPRSCHCAICGNCVEKFDHHCPWVSQCIGLRNYRFYLMFVSSALIFFIYVFVFSCRRINVKMSETGTGLLRTLGNFPETLALASFSFVAMWFLTGLASFHVYLIMLNQTSYENFRQCYVNSPNPYDKGILGNVKEEVLVSAMADRYGYFSNNGDGAEELSEADVWGLVRDKGKKLKDPSCLKHVPSASRMIPKSSNEAKVHQHQQQQSAPVRIPNWPKTYRKKSQKSNKGSSQSTWLDHDVDADDESSYGKVDYSTNKGGHHEDVDDDEEDESEWIPPHEWIARKLAKSQISSFSVCEGVGRTLKGRDLSKVRNAILTRTGFIEQTPFT